MYISWMHCMIKPNRCMGRACTGRRGVKSILPNEENKGKWIHFAECILSSTLCNIHYFPLRHPDNWVSFSLPSVVQADDSNLPKQCWQHDVIWQRTELCGSLSSTRQMIGMAATDIHISRRVDTGKEGSIRWWMSCYCNMFRKRRRERGRRGARANWRDLICICYSVNTSIFLWEGELKARK